MRPEKPPDHPKTIQHYKYKKPLRNILTAASLLLVPFSAHAENPVLNPGFEEDAATPVEWGISAVANGEEGELYDFSFWYKASGLVREDRGEPKQGYAHLQVFIFSSPSAEDNA